MHPRNSLILAALAAAGALVAGCAGETVTGRILPSGETFTGSTNPGTFGGSISLQGSSGTRCEGRTMSSDTVGSTLVVLTCDDSRAGTVLLLDGPTQSVGTGILGTEKISLTITR